PLAQHARAVLHCGVSGTAVARDINGWRDLPVGGHLCSRACGQQKSRERTGVLSPVGSSSVFGRLSRGLPQWSVLLDRLSRAFARSLTVCLKISMNAAAPAPSAPPAIIANMIAFSSSHPIPPAG